MKCKIMAALTISLMVFGSMAFFTVDSDAADSIVVEDFVGHKFTYDKATDKIVTIGYAATLTAVEFGHLKKIAATDTYGMYDYSKNDLLRDVNPEKVQLLDSIYNAAGAESIAAMLIQMVGDGKISYTDTIVLTSSATQGPRIYDMLTSDTLGDKKFTKVLQYYSITDYDKIVDFVRDMSVVLTMNENSNLVKGMELTRDTVKDGIKDQVKRDGIFINYTASSGAWSIGNTGSIAVSLMEAAGLNNIGRNTGVTGTTYGNLQQAIQIIDGDTDVLVVLSASYAGTVSEFKQEVFGDRNYQIDVVKLENEWNNYCPDSKDGLWAIASMAYPTIFEGAPPNPDGSGDDNMLIYVAAAVIATVAIVALAVVFLKKP